MLIQIITIHHLMSIRGSGMMMQIMNAVLVSVVSTAQGMILTVARLLF